jgi:hypothetical protein
MVERFQFRLRSLRWRTEGVERGPPPGAPPVKVDVAELVDSATPESRTARSTPPAEGGEIGSTSAAAADLASRESPMRPEPRA